MSTLDAAACVAAITLQQRRRVPLGPRLSFQPTTGKNMASRFFTLAKLFLEMSRQMIGGLQEMQGRNGFGEISTQSHAAEILNYRK